MKTIKIQKTRKVRRKKEDPDKVFSHMLEVYLMVPPSPAILKRERRSRNKKNKKISK